MDIVSKPFLYGTLVGAVAAVFISLLIRNLVAGGAPVKRPVPTRHAVSSPEFQRALDVLFGPNLTSGNRIETLENGVEIFPAMLDAIRGAEQTINFETYIYWSGEIADTFGDALIERARAGVEVNVLLDWVGSAKMDPELIERMREAGAKVERYKPPKWHKLDRFNSRTHRKILVVDGRVGFTGGVGIGDEWTGDAEDPDHWRDVHFQLEGPAVAQLQAAFLDNWLEVHQDVMLGEGYFPPLEPAGDTFAHCFISSPDEGSQSMQLLFLLAIGGARDTLRIATPYFVPDEITHDALLAAAERGVDVQIIVPGKRIDSDLARRASRGRWGPLLEAGIEIYEFQPTMYHSKMMVVDGLMASIGSTNFDNRSFQLNDEANLNSLDRAFAAEIEAVFESDLARSREVTLAAWRARPWHEKVRERASMLLESQL